MKNKLNIFCNDRIRNFLTTFFSEHELTFTKLNVITNNIKNSEANIIVVNNIKEADLIDFESLSDNCLIITNLKNINSNLDKKFKILYSPLSINQLKNKIENLLQNLNIIFHDISIDNGKLTNFNNNYFCYLTKIEMEIITYLIQEGEASKDFIKENILKIKLNIESNSLESHLTRIRKKMNKVKTTVKIQTKNEKLLITV